MAGTDKRASELTAPVSIEDSDTFPGYRPGTGGDPNLDIRGTAGLIRAPIIAGLASGSVTVAAAGVVIAADEDEGTVSRTIAERAEELILASSDHDAIGDGATFTGASIQASIDRAYARAYAGWGSGDLSRGSEVHLKAGNYLIDEPLYVRHGVRLVGAGKRATQIAAAPGFTGTQMIRIGKPTDPAGTFGASVSHLTIGMYGLSNIVGLDNPEGQEQCGAYDVLFRAIGAGSIGYRQDGTLAVAGDAAANCNIERCEFFPVSATATCAIIKRSSWKTTFSSNQMVSTSAYPAGAVGLIVDDAAVIANGVHCEYLTDGIKLINGGFLSVNMIKGGNNVDLVHLESVGRIHIAFAMETGGTNVINDLTAGRTISATAVSLYVRDGGATNNVLTTNSSQESALRGGVRFANGALTDVLYGVSGTISAVTINSGQSIGVDVTVTGISALYGMTSTLNVNVTGSIIVCAVLKATNTVRVTILNAGAASYDLPTCAARVFAFKGVA